MQVPDTFDPWKLANAEFHASVTLPLAKCERLHAAVLTCADSAQVTLSAGRDQQRRAWLQLEVHADVQLHCQRCLQPYRLTLRTSTRFAPTADAEREPPEDHELLLVEDGQVQLLELVEDELLLALPMVPKHADLAQCQALGYRAPEPAPVVQPASKPNPFAALAELKRKNSSQN